MERQREVDKYVYKYTLLILCGVAAAAERKAKTIASRQTWSESINSKTVFMLVVTSLQVFDSIQLINPNIAVPFCTPRLCFLSIEAPRPRHSFYR